MYMCVFLHINGQQNILLLYFHVTFVNNDNVFLLASTGLTFVRFSLIKGAGVP